MLPHWGRWRLSDIRPSDVDDWIAGLSDRMFSLMEYSRDCIVQHMLTLSPRLDAMHRLGRALADPTRCRILLALLDGPAYPAQLAATLGLTRSNVSNHLACARGCGLVVATPEGRQMRYELADAHLAHALRDLLDVVLAVEDGQPCIDEVPLPPRSLSVHE